MGPGWAYQLPVYLWQTFSVSVSRTQPTILAPVPTVPRVGSVLAHSRFRFTRRKVV